MQLEKSEPRRAPLWTSHGVLFPGPGFVYNFDKFPTRSAQRRSVARRKRRPRVSTGILKRAGLKIDLFDEGKIQGHLKFSTVKRGAGYKSNTALVTKTIQWVGCVASLQPSFFVCPFGKKTASVENFANLSVVIIMNECQETN